MEYKFTREAMVLHAMYHSLDTIKRIDYAMYRSLLAELRQKFPQIMCLIHRDEPVQMCDVSSSSSEQRST